MQKITINVPDDCEVQIVKKEEKKEPVIKTYQDLIDCHIRIGGKWISKNSTIEDCWSMTADICNKNIAASEKVAKSMLAMAMISQLMPYYGGEIINEDWKDTRITKWAIGRNCDKITLIPTIDIYYFLSFYTLEQCRIFLKYNEQLVKDYLMID